MKPTLWKGKPLDGVCERCGSPFKTYSRKRKWCSGVCAKAPVSSMAAPHPPTAAFGNRGAIGELGVSIDLMQRGYEVFRSVSAHASCDLIAVKGERMYRVEVRSAHVHKTTGKVYVNDKGLGRLDILAMYTLNGVIYLNPDKTPLKFAL